MKNFLYIFLIILTVAAISQARFYSSRRCNRPRAPRNGGVTCDPSTRNNSTCTFTCDEGYRLIGSYHTRCNYAYTYGNGRYTRYFWTDRSPYCQSDSCPVPEGINNADIECTGHRPGDYCHFECFHEYQLFPSDRRFQDCLPELSWSTTPCCAEEAHCSGDKKSDVVIALDSSIAFGTERWTKMKRFIRHFIDLFSVEPNITRFSIFRYDNDVDESSRILLNEFVNDRISMLESYDELPDDLNQGHDVIRALEYIASTVLTEENGDRPDVQDVILIVTKEPSYTTGPLHLPGFHANYTPKVFVLAVDALSEHLDPSSDPRDYWEDITHDKDAVYMAESADLSGLGSALQRDMGHFVCQIESCAPVDA